MRFTRLQNLASLGFAQFLYCTLSVEYYFCSTDKGKIKSANSSPSIHLNLERCAKCEFLLRCFVGLLRIAAFLTSGCASGRKRAFRKAKKSCRRRLRLIHENFKLTLAFYPFAFCPHIFLTSVSCSLLCCATHSRFYGIS